MSQRKVSFVSGEYYHVYNRGNSKQKIFLDENDYLRFIGLLFVCNSSQNFKIDNFSKKENLLNFPRDKEIVNIGSYCLMPNHFHILIADIDEGNISRFMQKLSTAYAMYFNKKYQRSGSLFEGKFKAEHASSDKYLKYLFSYINLNPVKLIEPKWKEQGIKSRAKVLDYLNEYSYSSYQDYMGKIRLENKILNKFMFPEYFRNKKDFEREIFDWINFNR
ncbi:MAG: transposase [Candidatus Pacebacteria bacterium]|nr:transposase [Candidatus Paceibacterota bacterium]